MRREDWPERLNDFIEDRRKAVFCWGQRDCVLFAADAVQAMTGVDHAVEYRGTYDSATGAARLLAKLGGVENVVPFASIPVAFAGRGDLVTVDTKDGAALAVCLGRHVAAMSASGLVFLPMSAADAAWRVE